MKYLLNNKVYDTEKAEEILKYIKTIEQKSIFGLYSYPKYEHTLYKTQKGNFCMLENMLGTLVYHIRIKTKLSCYQKKR